MIWTVLFLVALTLIRLGFSIAEKNGLAAKTYYHTAGESLEALIIVLVGVLLVVRPFIAQAYYIPSESMKPGLTTDDRILVNKLSYRLGGPSRHEVVVFRAPKEATLAPTGDEQDFVKRVVGLPGDTVEIRDGKTLVNGREDPDGFCLDRPDYDMPPMLVPAGKLFVMGDNRCRSNDSHRWGALDEDLLIGRAVLVFWPPTRAGIIR